MSALNQCRYCLATIPPGATYCTVCEIERSATGFEKLYGRDAGLQIQQELQERAERKRLSEKARRVGLPDPFGDVLDPDKLTGITPVEDRRRREQEEMQRVYEAKLIELQRQAYMDLMNAQIQSPFITYTQSAADWAWGQEAARTAKPAAPPKPKTPTVPVKPNKLGRQIDLDEE